MLRFG